MDPFSPRLLQIDNGTPAALKPVPFQGRVDELTLERWIVENPDLVGEPLLVLGHQLAEFEEDKDRLDILALDRAGEIVLVELKVSEGLPRDRPAGARTAVASTQCSSPNRKPY